MKNTNHAKPKALWIIIAVIVILFAAIFTGVFMITTFLPASFYDNPDLLTRFDGANKVRYRHSTQDGVITVTCGKMTGADVIWKYTADADISRQMQYTFQVTKGKAKLILITPDNNVTTLVEQDSAAVNDPESSESDFEHTIDLALKKGKNQIKIVCAKGTSFSLLFEIR